MNEIPYNHTDGQTFGTCNCTGTEFTGPQCLIQSNCPVCYHDAPCVNGICQCEPQYISDDCSVSTCVNMESGVPQLPDKYGNCPEDCASGYGGPFCRQIASQSACAPGKTWSDSLITKDTDTNWHCISETGGWSNLVHGRTDILTQCHKPTGWMNSTADGSCRFDFYRNSSDIDQYEEIFFCNFSECSWEFGREMADPKVTAEYIRMQQDAKVQEPNGAAALRYLLFIAAICVALLALFSERIRYINVVLPGSVGVVVVLLALNLFVASTLYADANKNRVIKSGSICSVDVAKLQCKKSNCLCTEDVKAPLNCADTSLFYTLVTGLKNGLTFVCDLSTHNCSFTHDDLFANSFAIGLFCHARDCVSSSATVEATYCEEASTDWTVVILVTVVSTLILGTFIWSIIIHFVRSNQAATEFANMAAADDNMMARQTGIPVSVRNIKYSVRSIASTDTSSHSGSIPSKLRILDDITIEFPPGSLTAVMGPSGCGKTTLLDILCFREKYGSVSGDVVIASREGLVRIGSGNLDAWRRVLSYVADDDAILPTLTVREALRYTVELRQPYHLPSHVKEKFVEDLIRTFQLGHCADTIVGAPAGVEDSGTGGLSAGERRRTAIAVHLACLPRILVLDEPTTGLDSFNARHVITCLHAACHGTASGRRMSLYDGCCNAGLCNRRPTIILSIHQPSMDILRRFDYLVLMASGRVVFAGPPSEKTLTEFIDYAMSKQKCTSPLFQEATKEGDVALSDQILLLASTLDSKETEKFEKEIDPASINFALEEQSCALQDAMEFERFLPQFWTQFSLLLQRGWTHVVRRNSILALHYLVASVIALLISFMYQSSDRDIPGSLMKAGAFTFYFLWLAVLNLSALDLILAERATFTFERNASYYSTGAYFMSKLLIDVVVLRIIPTAVSSTLIYFPIGLKPTLEAFMLFVGVTVLFSVTTTGLSILIASLAPSFGSGLLINGFVIIILFAFGGFISQANAIPVGLRWMKFISPFNFAFEIALVRDMEGQLCIFQPRSPDGTPTTEMAITLQCEQYLYNLNLRPDYIQMDIALLAGWAIVYFILAFIVLSFLVRGKR